MGERIELCTDPNGVGWTLEEIQLLVNHAGGLTKVGARLGLRDGVRKLRGWGILTPEEWFQELLGRGSDEVLRFLLRHGGVEGVADYLNVSERWVRRALCEAGYRLGSGECDVAEGEAALVRFGSVELAARWCGVSAHQLKKAVPLWREMRDLRKAGRTTSSIGRGAELFFERERGDAILESPAGQRPQHPGYDYVDRDWGRVNVKGAPPQSGSWVWEVDLGGGADSFALVQLDASKQPRAFLMVCANGILEGASLGGGLGCTLKCSGGMGLRTREAWYSPI